MEITINTVKYDTIVFTCLYDGQCLLDGGPNFASKLTLFAETLLLNKWIYLMYKESD